MFNELVKPVSVKWLSNQLGLIHIGKDVLVKRVSSFDDASANSISYSKNIVHKADADDIVLISSDTDISIFKSKITSPNPRLTFAKITNFLKISPGYFKSSKKPVIGRDTNISSSAKLGFGVYVGDRTVIGHNVVVADGVKIGKDCYIKSNTVIGEDGFGFERDEDGIPIRIQHLGSVIIGDRVEIGSLNTVCRATLGVTVIEDDVKTDDHVHIAHNCKIGKGSLITACVEFSGSVELGKYCWVGPNSSIIEKTKIGNNCFIGIGSNVTKNFEDNKFIAGNPARAIIKRS